MVERQLRQRGITDERVLEAMGACRASSSYPTACVAFAYADDALPIGQGQTISQPFVVATICSLLALRAPSGFSTSARGPATRRPYSPNSPRRW